ncbi:hypothetical protein, partial [Peterkaempfera griseoplana]|uniref:hypothetical protein n=1 Tax=Peterkaempfera griseoplana TaxID=66896 RepID=UPI000A3FF212
MGRENDAESQPPPGGPHPPGVGRRTALRWAAAGTALAAAVAGEEVLRRTLGGDGRAPAGDGAAPGDTARGPAA